MAYTKHSQIKINSPSTFLKELETANLRIRATDSREWFRQLNMLSLNEVDKSNRYTSVPAPGTMYFYIYDPKTKATLEYWDRHPLTIVLNYSSDGFLGLNLHYLPPKFRAILLDRMLATITDTRMDQNTKLTATYQMMKGLAKYRLFQPCIKKYLYGHLQSRPMKIFPDEWGKAIFLPADNFQQANKFKVWADSQAWNLT